MRRPLLITVFALATTASVATAAAATTTTASITGEVFVDIDADGERDAGEPGLAGVPVTLRTAAVVADSVTTDATGTYVFDAVAAGSYEVAVGSPQGLAVTTDEMVPVEVTDGGAATAAAIGLGTTLTDGPDVAVDVRPADGTASELAWEVVALDIGPDPAEGAIGVRLMLDGDHEITAADGTGWSCFFGTSVATCETDGRGSQDGQWPVLSISTSTDAAVGTALQLTATIAPDGDPDGAPLNDEDSATTTVGTAGTVTPTEDGGTDDAGLSETGAGVLVPLVASFGAAALGGGLVWSSRRR